MVGIRIEHWKARGISSQLFGKINYCADDFALWTNSHVFLHATLYLGKCGRDAGEIEG